jgi:hydrogenase-4 component B
MRVSSSKAERAVTWDCGYAAPSARMQYTGRSFGEWITERLTPRFLRAATDAKPPVGLFPSEAHYAADAPDPFQAKLYEPFLATLATRFGRARTLQQGNLNHYLLYTLITLVALLVWSVVSLGWVFP